MSAPKDRSRQRLRTRRELLRAGARLLARGKKPSMDEVAEEALVSRATAYRYFSGVDALLVEAPLEVVVPDPESVFRDVALTDPVERIDVAERAMHEAIYTNEDLLRHMLSHTLLAGAAQRQAETPVRQNRRTPLIEQALAPARQDLNDEVYDRLCAALALIFGTEAMVVFRDVVPTTPERARAVKSWTVKALVRSALRDSDAS